MREKKSPLKLAPKIGWSENRETRTHTHQFCGIRLGLDVRFDYRLLNAEVNKIVIRKNYGKYKMICSIFTLSLLAINSDANFFFHKIIIHKRCVATAFLSFANVEREKISLWFFVCCS